MTTFRADPAKTFAVVVGIERYGIPGADLDGPVRDACRFVRWLRVCEVPAKNIILFASPLEANAELAGLDVPWQPAGREPIFRCFTGTLPGSVGDLLLVFWGGHGLLTAGDRRLIYADANEVATLNLDLNSVLNSLHCDLFAGLPRQVVIVDACANHVEHLRAPEVFPCERYQAGCEQFVLYGARSGEVAKNDGLRKSGVFSTALLDELERRSSEGFPPDFLAVAEHLTGRFQELRAAGRTDQTPVFYWRQDWNGDSKQLGQIPEPRPEYSFEKPFQAPPLPAHFVPRPDVNEELKHRLLPGRPTSSGVLVISAIQGMGGIGKSTLASAVAHDPQVQARYPDGVLWVTLGQQPNLLSQLSGWTQALSDYNLRSLGVAVNSRHLRTLLYDKAALLVIDDVWDPDHARHHFLVGGPRCQVLITTRRANVADELGAGLIQPEVMSPEEALALLAARLKRDLGREDRDEASLLAEAVGFLPMALELAAARIIRGATWAELRSALEAEMARLEELEEPRQRRLGRARLRASFNLSLKAIWEEDRAAYEAFVWLGVLHEDAVIAAPMAATLWRMSEAQADSLLELVWSDALLLPTSPVRVGIQTWRGYRLHDLLHDLTRLLLVAAGPDGLDTTMKEAHGALLERYRARLADQARPSWSSLADDGYIHDYLTWHFQKAERADLVHDVLAEETATGNGWFEGRNRLGQVVGCVLPARLPESMCLIR